MPTFTQKDRPLAIETPLGADVLLLASLHGVERISQPFHFELAMLNEPAKAVAFDKLLGQPVTVTLAIPGAPVRYVHGMVSRLIQGRQVQVGDKAALIQYRAELTPKFGLLKKRIQNRIFQQMTVPAILAQVLSGLDVRVAITGQYQPRDYCVQYRESDFAFASRLMEEEGICYFFEHRATGHTMVITDAPNHVRGPSRAEPAHLLDRRKPARHRPARPRLGKTARHRLRPVRRSGSFLRAARPRSRISANVERHSEGWHGRAHAGGRASEGIDDRRLSRPLRAAI